MRKPEAWYSFVKDVVHVEMSVQDTKRVISALARLPYLDGEEVKDVREALEEAITSDQIFAPAQ